MDATGRDLRRLQPCPRAFALFRMASRWPLEVVRDGLFKEILHRKEWGDSEVNNIELTLAGRFRDSGLRNGVIDEFKVFDRCLTPPEVRLLSETQAGERRSSGLFQVLSRALSEPYRRRWMSCTRAGAENACQ